MIRQSLLASFIVAVPALLIQPPPVAAQTTNPNVAAFHPSPQHAVTLSTGQPAVSRYELTFYQAGVTEPLLSVDLGKPSPQADGVIRVDYTNRISSWPLPGVQCEARIAAIGPAGTGSSSPSNTFVYECSPRLSTTSDSAAAAGETGMVEVVAGTLCGWSATSSAAWLTITSGSAGVGTEWVTYTVAPNTTPSSRTGTLSVGGLAYTVTQAGASSQTNVPPTVSITKPVGGTSVKVGPPLRISAEAFDADGIAKVEFYANGTLIQTIRTGSYAVNWKLPSSGTYTLTAVAEDTRGARTTSVPVSVTGR